MEKCPPYQALFNKLGYGESQMLDKVGATAALLQTTFFLDMTKIMHGPTLSPTR